MQAIYNVLYANNCTLLFTLLQLQACKTVAQMLRFCDNLLDEMNGSYEDDMEQCGLVLRDGDVVFTQQVTREHAERVTARVYVQTVLNLLDAGEDACYDEVQRYCMLAIVQREIFVESTL